MFSCLGIACEANNYKFDYEVGDRVGSCLGYEMQYMLELRSGYGVFSIPDHKYSASTLANLNDSYNLSFKEIAEFIRANPKAVFKDQQDGSRA